jgi:hypothetical protein
MAEHNDAWVRRAATRVLGRWLQQLVLLVMRSAGEEGVGRGPRACEVARAHLLACGGGGGSGGGGAAAPTAGGGGNVHPSRRAQIRHTH